MKKGLFTGWREIFIFTFMQNIKTKAFKIALIGIGILFFAIFFAINIITGFAMNDKKDEKKCNLNEINVINDTSIETMDFSQFNKFSKSCKNAKITVTKDQDPIELLKTVNDKHTNAIVVRITEEQKKNKIEFTLMAYIPEHLSKKDDNINVLMKELKTYFNQNKLGFAGISGEINTLIANNAHVNITNVDKDDESIGEMLAKLFIPMIFVLLIYMLIIMHGQSISKNIMVEKSSKLMETLLTSVEPYAIILGKILAMYVVAIVQVFAWAIFGLTGFFIGNRIAHGMFDKFDNPIIKVANILKDGSSSAFSISSIVLGVAALLLGFLMYCVLAGLITSSINKSEDLSNTQSIFQVIVVFSFLISYFLPFMKADESIINIFRYVPFTAAFMIPSDVMIGNIGIVGSIISILIILITTTIMIIFTGKIYKKKVF